MVSTYGKCADGKAGRGCYGEVQNWKDLSPRVGFAWDVFGNGRTAVKASVARYVAGQQLLWRDRSIPLKR